MQGINHKLTIQVEEKAYKKDPMSSDLGKKIIQGSVDMIDDLGFEKFTFKKLSCEIKSTEASIYRYFENKQQLLNYLLLWYWGWLQYRLILELYNIEDAMVRLEKAITLLTEEVKEDGNFSQVNEVKLNRIVIAESSKVYLNKKVEQNNKFGLFQSYKDIVDQVSDIILEINKNYKYPHMLVSTVIEGAHHQRYFAEHLPKLTDIIEGEDSVTTFYNHLVLNTINNA